MRSRLLFALLVALLMAACGGGGGASCSAPAAIAGTWSGGINDSRAGSGTLTIGFTQSACALGGSWQTQFPDPSSDGSGTLFGNADGTQVSLNLMVPTASGCGYQASGTLTGPDTIGGSFGTVGTNCNSTGSFVLHLQSTSVPTPIPTPTS